MPSRYDVSPSHCFIPSGDPIQVRPDLRKRLDVLVIVGVVIAVGVGVIVQRQDSRGLRAANVAADRVADMDRLARLAANPFKGAQEQTRVRFVIADDRTIEDGVHRHAGPSPFWHISASSSIRAMVPSAWDTTAIGTPSSTSRARVALAAGSGQWHMFRVRWNARYSRSNAS